MCLVVVREQKLAVIFGDAPEFRRNSVGIINGRGGVAQLVERILSMDEVLGSIPGASTLFELFCKGCLGEQKHKQCN